MITDLWLIDSSANTRSALHILSYKCNLFIDRPIFVSDIDHMTQATILICCMCWPHSTCFWKMIFWFFIIFFLISGSKQSWINKWIKFCFINTNQARAACYTDDKGSWRPCRQQARWWAMKEQVTSSLGKGFISIFTWAEIFGQTVEKDSVYCTSPIVSYQTWTFETSDIFTIST